MRQKGFVNIAIMIVIIIIVVGAAGYFALNRQGSQTGAVPAPTPEPVACAQDAKLCPDGSYVSRTAPRCEFAPCPNPAPTPTPTPKPIPLPLPSPTPNETKIYLREGQKEGPLLVEKISADSITGLRFREYPVAMLPGSPITLRIGESVSNGCTITLTLTGINGNVAAFTEKTDSNRPCPICLAENTLIDTPTGAVRVQDLRKGATVWTADSSGARISAKIIEAVRTPVPATHRVIHLLLADGRELFASLGHPTGDGRVIGDLVAGDTLDGSRVTATEDIPYQKQFTYDILPSGTTGFYWANGILMGSTLFHAE